MERILRRTSRMTDRNNMIVPRFTTDEGIASEVSRYAQNAFEQRGAVSAEERGDEPFTKIFREIAERADTVQSALDALLANKSVQLSAPALARLSIHRSFAGNIPVIFTESVADFEKLVCALAYRGVFSGHIKNMGASFLHGKTKAFVILSNKPYSNVPAADLGLDEETWANYSVVIRREHECLHYYTRKFYGAARNHLHDELIADFVGIVSAIGAYKAGWFLKFLGIDQAEMTARPSEYAGKTAKKRFDIYTEGLSADAARVMQDIAAAAAHSLEKYGEPGGSLPATIDFLCSHDLLELADGGVFEEKEHTQ
jgi:hypothetical protein